MATAGPRILITGVSGQIGGALLSVAKADGYDVQSASRREMDLAAPGSGVPFLDQCMPDIVVNCAAYTAVDQAETDPALAFRINADAPERLALWCSAHDRLLIHLSTDYVFSGESRRPYREEDEVGPTNIYGASKLDGERRLRRACVRHIILRTAWIYSATGNNFVKTMLRLGVRGSELNVVADQHGCPTAACSVARALGAILARYRTGSADDVSGTYHYVDRGETTWHGFAERIFAEAERHRRHHPIINPVATELYPTLARRPSYSVLDTGRFQDVFGMTPPFWQDSLALVLAEIFRDSPSMSSV